MPNIQHQVQDTHQSADIPQVCAVVLYVEDNAANLELVENLLARRGNLTLLSARDALSGIALARLHQPAVILMDIKLPGMSGTDALRVLSDDPLTSHIPVIALSSDAYARQIAMGLQAGFYRYLTKPFKIDEFMDAVEAALHAAEDLVRNATAGV